MLQQSFLRLISKQVLWLFGNSLFAEFLTSKVAEVCNNIYLQFFPFLLHCLSGNREDITACKNYCPRQFTKVHTTGSTAGKKTSQLLLLLLLSITSDDDCRSGNQ